jgi:hypothetical protein
VATRRSRHPSINEGSTQFEFNLTGWVQNWGFLSIPPHSTKFDQPLLITLTEPPQTISGISSCLRDLSTLWVWYPNCPVIDVAWAEKAQSTLPQ